MWLNVTIVYLLPKCINMEPKLSRIRYVNENELCR